VCVYIYILILLLLRASFCVLLLPSFTLLLLLLPLDDEHSFVILLRATDWLNVYLFVVRVVVVVVAVSARRSEHVCSTIYEFILVKLNHMLLRQPK